MGIMQNYKGDAAFKSMLKEGAPVPEFSGRYSGHEPARNRKAPHFLP